MEDELDMVPKKPIDKMLTHILRFVEYKPCYPQEFYCKLCVQKCSVNCYGLCKVCWDFGVSCILDTLTYESMIDTILYEYEDMIPSTVDITPGMYAASKIIDGVRMYPYVVTSDGKAYLE